MSDARPPRRPAKPPADPTRTDVSAAGDKDDRTRRSTLDSSAPPTASAGRDLPKQIGRFQVRGFLGAGAFGTVYRAHDPQLDREVALKVAPATQSAERLQRFRREAKAAAGLRHPNIVPLFEAGTADGHLFLASAFVPGTTLEDALLDDNADGLPPERAATIVRKLADALAYAHGQKVLHRDVKSANVMLDPDGEPHLLDFGLARRSEDADRMTADGSVLGTPAYMAPEIADGGQARWAPAVDQYALGIVLYELLTGRTPFAGPIEIVLALHRMRDPGRPSKKNPAVPRDLDAICLKCLEKEPARRYASAAALRDDLDRFLRGDPVLARRQSYRYLMGKFARRYRTQLRVAAAVLLVAVSGTAFAFYKIDHARQEAIKANTDLSREQQALVEKNEQFEDQLYTNWIGVAERELTARGDGLAGDVGLASSLLARCPEKRRGWEWHYLMRLRDGPPPPTDKAERHERGLWGVSYSPDGKRFATASIDGTVRVWDAATGRRQFVYEGHTLPLTMIDRNTLPVPIPKGMPLPLNPFKLLPKVPLPVPDPAAVLHGAVKDVLPSIPVKCVAFSPDGRSVASGSVALGTDPLKPKELRGVVKIWNPENGSEEVTFAGQVGVVLSIAYSPDGKRIASSSINDDHSFVVWDTKTGGVLGVIRGHTSHVQKLRYSPDGKFIAAGDNGGTLRLWDAATFEEVRAIPAHTATVVDVTFTPTGERVATSSNDGTVRVWDVATGERAQELRGHHGAALAVTYSPDGKRIATGGFDNTIRLWDAVSGAERLTLRGHTDMVWGVAFSPDGGKIVSASFDRDFKIWDTAPRSETTGPGLFTIASPTSDRVNVLAFGPGDGLLATGGWDNAVRLWDGRTGALRRTLAGHTGVVFGVAFNRDGTRIASSSWDHTVKVWDTATGREVLTFNGHKAPVQSVAFSPDGKQIASTGWDGRVLIWDAATGEVAIVCDKLLGIALPTVSVAFSPDGRRIATGRTDRSVVVWDAESGRATCTLEGHEGVVPCVRFSPDGQLLATASWDKTAKVWDVSGRVGRLVRTLEGHADRVHGVAFSPDGARIATAGDDKTVRVWDAKTGVEVESLRRRHRAGVWSVAFSGDGKRLATACWSPDGWVRTWDAAPDGWRR